MDTLLNEASCESIRQDVMYWPAIFFSYFFDFALALSILRLVDSSSMASMESQISIALS